ncbi:MAG: rod shape-determining protein MreC, partial [Alphaproteobacteria bacterium]
ILLLTDLNARIPVVIESTRVPAILAGDNTDRPRLTFLPVNARVSPGDRIVTSGQGGMLPPGLPVGLVAVVEDNIALVQLFVDWHTLEYVRVLDYTLPGVLPSTRAAGRTGPIR